MAKKAAALKLEEGDQVTILETPRSKQLGIAGKSGKVIATVSGKPFPYVVEIDLGNTKAIHRRAMKAAELEVAKK